jgi:Bacteriocin-protection, YdeI or OmpD-Associated/Domain of unknown function (DUF1905)
MDAARFSATLQAGRGGGAFVEVPNEVLAGLGASGRFRVIGTVNGVELSSSTMPIGAGRVCLGVHKATRQAAAVNIGDDVQLEIQLDTRARTLHIPEDLAAALARNAPAAAAFERLSFSHRREYVEWVAVAKRDDTRARRITKTLERLTSPVTNQGRRAT